ncbi:hypothetical protein EB796_021776 [Bugula neritina]|uniref:RIC3 n=1 Tax=Bugula neritina TaxID=10212 RepID=A0A7J7J263_BUGNE|nr:hypothetical protein EB796_021776 [Bugula neritina]
MVLPLYAGGIFIYLIYTGTKAYKNHGTKKVTKDPHEEVYNLITERLAHLDLEKILSGEDNDGAAEINKLAEMLRDKYNGEGRREDWYDDFEDEVEVIEAASDDAPNTPTSSNPVTKPSLISGS